MVTKSTQVHTCVTKTNKYDVIIIFSAGIQATSRDEIPKPINSILPSPS